MIVDSSALVAVIFAEPEAQALLAALMEGGARISAATLFETGMVIDRKAMDEVPAKALERLIALIDLEVVPFTGEQADLARQAYDRFGKGRHPAQLNFGDCFAYALARHSGEPLLYKGDDFAQTDVIAAV